MPFAWRAVPLVRDRAPLVAPGQIVLKRREAVEQALPGRRARRRRPRAPSAQRVTARMPCRALTSQVSRPSSSLRCGAPLRDGRVALARELDQERPRDPGQDRRVVGHRAQRPPSHHSRLVYAPSSRRPSASASTASPAPCAAARSRRAASRSRSGPLRRGSAARIGHVGDPGHDGRLARRRRAHREGELAVRAQLDTREPAAVSGHGRARPARGTPPAPPARRRARRRRRRSAPSGVRRRARGRRRRARNRPPAAPSSARGGELAAGRKRAADRLEHRARLEQHLVVLGVRVRGGDDRPARPDLQAVRATRRACG